MQDLEVSKESSCLEGKKFDWIISGSIAAVEAVKSIRALRRLGAEVRAFLTQSGARFVTPESCRWACGQDIVTSFEAISSHLADGDALVVAPMTADFAAKASLGISDTPALSLFASYMGRKESEEDAKSIILHPNMHLSLWQNPIWQRAYQELRTYAEIVPSVEEEGKQKFISADILAAHIAHIINKKSLDTIISMGRTEEKVDDVRYLSNKSRGEMGSAIAEDLYLHGVRTHIVRGRCEVQPRFYSSQTEAYSNRDMQSALEGKLLVYPKAALVMAAAVLDYSPRDKCEGKISSTEESMALELVRMPKIIEKLRAQISVVFKLEDISAVDLEQELVAGWFSRTRANMLIVNSLRDMRSGYRAYIYTTPQKKLVLRGKRQVASAICDKLLRIFAHKFQSDRN